MFQAFHHIHKPFHKAQANSSDIQCTQSPAALLFHTHRVQKLLKSVDSCDPHSDSPPVLDGPVLEKIVEFTWDGIVGRWPTLLQLKIALPQKL